VKGQRALSFDSSGNSRRLSGDQYDPLGLFTREQKAKRVLEEEQIRRVASQFGVSYEEALEEAKSQGYIPPPPPGFRVVVP